MVVPQCKFTTLRIEPRSLNVGEDLRIVDIGVRNTSGYKAQFDCVISDFDTGEEYFRTNDQTVANPGKEAHWSIIAYFWNFSMPQRNVNLSIKALITPYGGGAPELSCATFVKLFLKGGVPAPACEANKLRCDGVNRQQCIGGNWVTIQEKSKICGFVAPGQCTPEGAFRCLGMDRQQCQWGEWKTIESNSSLCGYEPPPGGCSEGFFRCLHNDRQQCINGKWETIESNSRLCGYEPDGKCSEGLTKKVDMGTFWRYLKCTANGIWEKITDIAKDDTTTPPPPTPPPTPPTCPKGTIYTRGLFQECDTGYYQGDLPGGGLMGKGAACICAEGYKPDEEDKPGLNQLFDYVPVLVLGGVVIAAIGLFKK